MDGREPQVTGTRILPVTTSATINEQRAPEVATIGRESPRAIQTETKRKRGRPKKKFCMSSSKSKNRKVSKLIEANSLEEIEYAANKLKRRSNSYSESQHNLKCLPISKALALYMDLDLSERKYVALRQTINEIHPNCLPSLYALRREKHKFVPPITATEVSAEVDLKTVMRRTAERVVELCDAQGEKSKLSLECKWGMDGSSGHSRYKQKFESDNHTDEFMFFIAFVPLR